VCFAYRSDGAKIEFERVSKTNNPIIATRLALERVIFMTYEVFLGNLIVFCKAKDLLVKNNIVTMS